MLLDHKLDNEVSFNANNSIINVDFKKHTEADELTIFPTVSNCTSVYNELSPAFKVLCASFESQADEVDVKRMKEYLYREMCQVKKNFLDMHPNFKDKGALISSHIPSCKRRKSMDVIHLNKKSIMSFNEGITF